MDEALWRQEKDKAEQDGLVRHLERQINVQERRRDRTEAKVVFALLLDALLFFRAYPLEHCRVLKSVRTRYGATAPEIKLEG